MLVVVVCRLVLLGRQAFPVRTVDLGVAVALLVPAALALWPYRIVQQEMGLRRSLEDSSVPWASFLASSSHADTLLWSFVPSSADQRGDGTASVPRRAADCAGGGSALRGAGRAGWTGGEGREGREGRVGRAGRGVSSGAAAVRSGSSRPAGDSSSAARLATAGALSVALYIVLTAATRVRNRRRHGHDDPADVARVGAGGPRDRVRAAISPRVPQLLVWLHAVHEFVSSWRAAHRDIRAWRTRPSPSLSLSLAVDRRSVLAARLLAAGVELHSRAVAVRAADRLGLAVLAGLGFSVLPSRLSPRGRLRRLSFRALLVAEFAAFRSHSSPIVSIPRSTGGSPASPRRSSLPKCHGRTRGTSDMGAARGHLHAPFDRALAEDRARLQRLPLEQIQTLLTELAEFPASRACSISVNSASPTSWSTRISFRPRLADRSSSESPGSADR